MDTTYVYRWESGRRWCVWPLGELVTLWDDKNVECVAGKCTHH